MTTQHDEYYMQDGDVVFLVGNTLFKIHKRVLTRSEASTFTTMFSLPTSSQTEGQTDETPIILQGDALEDFECLMRILYPPVLDDIWKIPVRTLLSAMRIASKYEMEDIQMAITRIITNMTSLGIGQAIERLAFMAEFSTNFSVSLAGAVFLQACSISSTPSANDLKPLLGQPALIAGIIENRERMLRSEMEAELRSRGPQPPRNWDSLLRSASPIPQLEAGLLGELHSLGFSQ